ncbi:50S ribosomal protein L24 [Candidatus Woesearchaeota archaeon]|nr:50S ribosomal protein L24 [Candidatus Woesearchaeota archaeon]
MKWSSAWKSSKQPTKQRKYARNAPKHVRSKQLSSHLSADLRKKHGKRSMRIRNGDKVKVMIGNFKGKTGKVERVDTKKQRIYITGIELLKKDGSKTLYPIKASNIMIQELDLSDKRRLKKK